MANSDKQISIMKRMSDMSTEQVEAFNKTSETFRRLENSLNECFASIKTISDNIRTMTEEKDKETGQQESTWERYVRLQNQNNQRS